MRGVTLVL